MRTIPFLLVMSLLAGLHCSTHRLHEYRLNDTTVAARTFPPPRANVYTHFNVHFDLSNPVETALSLGSTIAKEGQAARARARLDSAMAMVDIPLLIEEEVLFSSSELLQFRPVNEVELADFVFNIDIKGYGIDAHGWDAGTYFVVDTHVELVDNENQRRVWRTHMEEKEPLAPRMFGLGHSAENILDAMALSKLTVEEIAAGLENLAGFTAQTIAKKLYRDYQKSREKASTNNGS